MSGEVETKETTVTVTGLGFYEHNFNEQPGRGTDVELVLTEYKSSPAVAVYVGGKRYGSIKKNYINEAIRILTSDKYVRSYFPRSYTHIRHRSVCMVEKCDN